MNPTDPSPSADIGVIGLAVMGQNLVLNLADNGYTVAVHNRTTSVTEEFISGSASDFSVMGSTELGEFVSLLKRPRRVLLMVKAGPAVDTVLDQLLELLEDGDIVIDGGNSRYTDTDRRAAEADAAGIHYVGAGISGGEVGARHGPSIMPGGAQEAWSEIGDMFQAVAARTPDGTPCCDWIGPGGSGHYVKMVHNGIEYGDMQVIAEAYSLMKAMGRTHEEMADSFTEWNSGVLDSYLIEITAQIMGHPDDDGQPLLERILDTAGQKGTGRWTVVSSMDLAQPVTLVAEAVFARIVSALKEQRVTAAKALSGPTSGLTPDALTDDDLRDAVYAAKIVSYAQGFMLLAGASSEHEWDLDLGRIAGLWRAGCIIRARFLEDITTAYERDATLMNLMLDPFFTDALADSEAGLRRVVATAAAAGVPVPCYSSALAFYDAYRSETTAANLIQAQRDFFGAHTYERVDRPRGEMFHTEWAGS